MLGVCFKHTYIPFEQQLKKPGKNRASDSIIFLNKSAPVPAKNSQHKQKQINKIQIKA